VSGVSDIRRSVLFTPADDPEMMRKATATPADAVVFDLEDAVPTDHLSAAREHLRTVVPDIDTDVEVGVRINGVGTEWWLDDLRAATHAGVDAVLVPMVESPGELTTLAAALDTVSAASPTVRLAIETPTGLLAVERIATRAADIPAVTGLSFGVADYARALGAPGPSDAIRDRLAFRISTVAAAYGLDAFASTHLDIDDDEGLQRVAESSRALGFDGMSAIHPRQLSIINDAFTPDEERVARARRLVAAYEDADADSIRVEGAFLDEATVAHHRATIERYEAIRGET